MMTLTIDASVVACQAVWVDTFPGQISPGWTQGRYTEVTLDGTTGKAFSTALKDRGYAVVDTAIRN